MTIEQEYYELLKKYHEIETKLIDMAKQHQEDVAVLEDSEKIIEIFTDQEQAIIHANLIEQIAILNRLMRLKPHIGKHINESEPKPQYLN